MTIANKVIGKVIVRTGKKTIVPACIDVFQVASQCCGGVHKVAAMVFGEAVGAVVGLLLFLELMFFLTLAFFAAVAV